MSTKAELYEELKTLKESNLQLHKSHDQLNDIIDNLYKKIDKLKVQIDIKENLINMYYNVLCHIINKTGTDFKEAMNLLGHSDASL